MFLRFVLHCSRMSTQILVLRAWQSRETGAIFEEASLTGTLNLVRHYRVPIGVS